MAPRAGWIAAGDLVLGDRLRTPTGTDATVLGVRRDVDRAAVYTLTVAKDHTFFVGTAQVLVHNADCEEVVKLAQELKFTATAGAHQAEASRRVPLYTLADAILHGRRVPDPQAAADAVQITAEIFLNGQRRLLRIVYREADKQSCTTTTSRS